MIAFSTGSSVAHSDFAHSLQVCMHMIVLASSRTGAPFAAGGLVHFRVAANHESALMHIVPIEDSNVILYATKVKSGWMLVESLF